VKDVVQPPVMKSLIVILALSLASLTLLAQDARRSNPANDAWVKISAGAFLMGSPNGGDNEKPAHQVMITRGFEMGKYEVTQAQWQTLMGGNPSQFGGADLPVEQVSWEDVQSFIRAMNAQSDGYVNGILAERRMLWERRSRTGGVCTTCTGMCGSGSRIGTTRTITRIAR
jgi:formylglycine-generating enzyme required for sulfatase activity